MSLDAVIRNGTVATGSDIFQADVAIAGGKVVAIGKDVGTGTREIDARGKYVIPGGIDVHTHLDHHITIYGMAITNVDDFFSGTVAAACGGITTICDYIFQHKGRPVGEAVEEWLPKAKDKAVIDYGFHICITDPSPKALGEIPDLMAEGYASLKAFMCFSGFGLDSNALLQVLQAARESNVLVNIHAEDGPIIDYLTQKLLAEGRTGPENWPKSRPVLTEASATARAIDLAEAVDTPIYIVHLSCRDALQAVQAGRARGLPVYTETRPVYLFLSEERYDLPNREGGKYKCAPPLRHHSHQKALWDGLRSDDIQTVASDNSSWMAADKTDPAKNFLEIPAGVSNLETMLPMVYSEGVGKGRISLSRFVQVMCTNPAKLFGMYPEKGTIAVGSDADIVILDPEKKVTIRAKDMHSRSDYDPYEGFEVQGWPILTMSRGEVICDNGKVTANPGRGRLLKRRKFTGL
ncbi:MAG: dihydropyrimidinase [Dehalococcoidia bacterium]